MGVTFGTASFPTSILFLSIPVSFRHPFPDHGVHTCEFEKECPPNSGTKGYRAVGVGTRIPVEFQDVGRKERERHPEAVGGKRFRGAGDAVSTLPSWILEN